MYVILLGLSLVQIICLSTPLLRPGWRQVLQYRYTETGLQYKFDDKIRNYFKTIFIYIPEGVVIGFYILHGLFPDIAKFDLKRI